MGTGTCSTKPASTTSSTLPIRVEFLEASNVHMSTFGEHLSAQAYVDDQLIEPGLSGL